VSWIAPLNLAAMLRDEPADIGQLLIASHFLGKPGSGAQPTLTKDIPSLTKQTAVAEP